jgi:hypothetical protein
MPFTENTEISSKGKSKKSEFGRENLTSGGVAFLFGIAMVVYVGMFG